MSKFHLNSFCIPEKTDSNFCAQPPGIVLLGQAIQCDYWQVSWDQERPSCTQSTARHINQDRIAKTQQGHAGHLPLFHPKTFSNFM
jgi:hypothetical protein